MEGIVDILIQSPLLINLALAHEEWTLWKTCRIVIRGDIEPFTGKTL